MYLFIPLSSLLLLCMLQRLLIQQKAQNQRVMTGNNRQAQEQQVRGTLLFHTSDHCYQHPQTSDFLSTRVCKLVHFCFLVAREHDYVSLHLLKNVKSSFPFIDYILEMEIMAKMIQDFIGHAQRVHSDSYLFQLTSLHRQNTGAHSM